MKFNILLFLGIIYLIDPMQIGFVAGYLLVLVMLASLNELIPLVDKLSLILFSFSIVYVLFYSFNPDSGAQFLFIYAFFPVTFYLLGKYIFIKSPHLFQNPLTFVILSALFSFTAILSVGTSLLENGFDFLNRNITNFWTGNEENATYTGGFFLLNMCLPGVLIVSWKQLKLWHRLLLVLIFITSLLCVLRLGSRTQLLIAVFSIIGALLYIVARQSTKKNFILLTGVFLAINIGFGYLNIDKDADFISAYTDRMESKKYGANTAGGRTERWEKSLNYLVKKPMGWDLNEFGYSHNLWFDVLRVGGILSFFLLVYASFLSLKLLLDQLKKNKHIDPFLGTIALYTFAFYLLFFVEPIFEGYFQIFVFHCFTLGLLSAYKDKIINKTTIDLISSRSK